MSAGEGGQSLIQVLIAVAIMGVLMAALMTLSGIQSREMAAAQQKMAALDLQNSLLSSLLTSSVCDFVLNSPTSLTFNSLRLPTKISIPASRPVPMNVNPGPPPQAGPIVAQIGTSPSPLSETLEIRTIDLEVSSGANGSYMANWVVDFDQTKLVRSIKPIRISTALYVNDSIPTASRIIRCGAPGEWLSTVTVVSTVKSCGGQRPNCPAPTQPVSATCPVGYTVTGCGYGLDWNPVDNGDGSNYHSNAPDTNFVSGNGCIVEAGGMPGCGVCFESLATCMKFQ